MKKFLCQFNITYARATIHRVSFLSLWMFLILKRLLKRMSDVRGIGVRDGRISFKFNLNPAYRIRDKR